jgi:colicin import membrane protein
MWLLLLEPTLLPPNGGNVAPHSLIMPVDEQNVFPAYAPSLVHSHKAVAPLGVLNLLALSPAERRERRKRNRKLRELEKQKAVGSSSINLISAETFASRQPALPGDSVDAFTAASAAPRLPAASRWTQLLAIIDEQRKDGSWAEDRAGPRDPSQHAAAMKLLAVSDPAATHSAFTMTPFQLLHVAAGAAFSAPLAVLSGLTTAFRSWGSNGEAVAPAPAQQQQESQGGTEAEPVAYWIGSNGPKEMVVAESIAQTTVAHRKPRPRQQQQGQQQGQQVREQSPNTQLKSTKLQKQEQEQALDRASRQALQVATDSISASTTFTKTVVANKTAAPANAKETEAEAAERMEREQAKRAAVKKLEAAKAEAAKAKQEREAALAAKKAAAEKRKAEAAEKRAAEKLAEEAEEKRKAERKAGSAAAIAQKVASYRMAASKAEANYEAEDTAERAKAAADKVASLTKAIDEQIKPQTSLRRNETQQSEASVTKAHEAIRFAEKEVAAKAAQEKQAALRLEQIKKIVAQRSKERDSAKRKVALEAAEALSDVQSAEEAARAKMDAAKAVHAAAKAKAGVDAAEALSAAKSAVGVGGSKAAAKARAEASAKMLAAATAKREAAVKAKLAAEARAAAAAKKQASMRATLVATPKAAPRASSKLDSAKAESKDSGAARAEHPKETEHAVKQKQKQLEHKATALAAKEPAGAWAKGGSEFPAVGRFLGEAKKVNSGRWAQLASLSTKVAALKDSLHEKETSH